MDDRPVLTDEQIIEIYQAAWRGEETQIAIGKKYGVSLGAVSRIKMGRAFTEITGHQTEKDWFEEIHDK